MPDPSSTAIRLAGTVENRADDEEREFALLLLWLFAELRMVDIAEVAIIGEEFLSRLDQIIVRTAQDTRTWSADIFSRAFNVNQQTVPSFAFDEPGLAPLLNRELLNEENLIRRRARRMIEELTTKARQHAALSGAQGPQNYADIAISKSEAYNLQKALDASVLNSVGHEFWLQGLGRFEKKQVVAILDKDTTQLCRGLHGSIWDWTEPIVDKSSGGSRMFPPFIGSIFVPRFHKCRSIIVPVI